MSRSAARSTRLSTPRRPGCRFRPRDCPNCGAWAWRSSTPSRPPSRSSIRWIAGLNGIYGTIFTGPPERSDADLRNVTIFADAEVDRSPCGTGTCAVMAVLDAMGLLPPDRAFGHESLIGTLFSGRITGRTRVAGFEAILPELEGSAWITGEHVFLVDDEDPLKGGFRL